MSTPVVHDVGARTGRGSLRGLCTLWMIMLAPPAAAADVAAVASTPFVADQRTVSHVFDSQDRFDASNRAALPHEVRVANAPWLRLRFDRVEFGQGPPDGQPARLRLTSLADGAVQTLDEHTLRHWRNTSAYFNGDAVRIEVLADPRAAPTRIVISQVIAGERSQGGIAGTCDGVDERVPSNDPRVARTLPLICTAWLIDDANHCFLSAGHCFQPPPDPPEAVEFNVPPSLADGTIQHPAPKDQYPVDPESVQLNPGPLTQNPDWAYFGCFPNSETGLTPFQAQRAFFTTTTDVPVRGGLPLRTTGYGQDITPPEANGVQQTSIGETIEVFVHSVVGPVMTYAVDSGPGTSGSPLFLEASGVAIGLHTGINCFTIMGGVGTPLHHPNLQDALANPLGVCAPQPSDLNHDGQVNGIDLGILLASWSLPPGSPGCAGAKSCPADINSDGHVDGVDLGILLANWTL